MGIHLKENCKHIGNIKIDPINKKHGTGEYGIMMGDKDEWGKRLNSTALKNPSLIIEASLKFGAQCVVVIIDYKKDDNGNYFV